MKLWEIKYLAQNLTSKWQTWFFCELGPRQQIPQAGWLKQQHLFLTVLEAGKPKVKVLSDLVPGEDPLPDLQTAAFLLCLTLPFLSA